MTVDDGVRLERGYCQRTTAARSRNIRNCADVFLQMRRIFHPERLAELDVTGSFENQELEACVQAIADRIWQETGK